MAGAETFDYLVIGDPVAHSRSPQMQNAAFEFYGMGSPYGKLRVDPAEIGEFAAYARRHLKGVNLTVPHKQVILPFVDELSPGAAACQSVNTLKIVKGRIFGFSTDGDGISGALRQNFGMALAGLRVVMLGAGGAATAIAFETAERRSTSLTIANRTREKAEDLARRVRARFPGMKIDVCALGDEGALGDAFARADLLIQVTSLGLKESDPPPVDLNLLKRNPRLRVFDAVYRETPLLKAARALGLPAADGSEMLIWQGAASFEIWTGKPAPIEAMRAGFKRAE